MNENQKMNDKRSLQTATVCLLWVTLSGCATFGEVEALNEIEELSHARETVSVYNKTLNTVGVQSRSRSAATINRAYGHTRQIDVDVNDINQVPYKVRDMQELNRYYEALTR